MPVTNNIEIGALTRSIFAYSVSRGQFPTTRGLLIGFYPLRDTFPVKLQALSSIINNTVPDTTLAGLTERFPVYSLNSLNFSELSLLNIEENKPGTVR